MSAVGLFACITKLSCRHKIRSNVWRSLRLESHNGRSFDKTIEKALYAWINHGNTNGTKETVIRWKDECSAPHCNEECPEHIVLSTLSVLWETEYKLAICISILSLSLICALVRFILQICRYRLTKNQKQFMENLASNPYREETLDVSISKNKEIACYISYILCIVQLPINDKAVSVACLNLHYFVYVSKAVLKQAESCRTSARNRLMSIAVMADDTPEVFTTATAHRRTSVTRMVQRRKSMAHTDNTSIDDIDNEQSMLSKQIAC